MLPNDYGGHKMLTFASLVLSKSTIFVRECLVLCLVLSSPSGLVNSTNCRELLGGHTCQNFAMQQCEKSTV